MTDGIQSLTQPPLRHRKIDWDSPPKCIRPSNRSFLVATCCAHERDIIRRHVASHPQKNDDIRPLSETLLELTGRMQLTERVVFQLKIFFLIFSCCDRSTKSAKKSQVPQDFSQLLWKIQSCAPNCKRKKILKNPQRTRNNSKGRNSLICSKSTLDLFSCDLF